MYVYYVKKTLAKRPKLHAEVKESQRESITLVIEHDGTRSLFPVARTLHREIEAVRNAIELAWQQQPS